MKLGRVVIGMDFSEPTIAAARWTARHFAHGAELVLAHAIDVPRPPRFLRGRFPPEAALLETAREGAQRHLREVSDSIGAERVWMEVRTGRAAEQIVGVARDFGADLVVVGKHRDRAGIWNRLGSTAQEVVRTSPAPVLLAAGHRDTAPTRILAALDDADVTPWMLEWTHLLATRFEADVTALHVVSSAVLGHVLSAAPIGPDAERESALELAREVRGEADRWMREFLATGLPQSRVHSEVAFGEAGQEIVAAAERMESDLIIVGRRGAGTIPRALVGSVTNEVLRDAPCPTLVVKELEDEIVDPIVDDTEW